MELYFKFRDKQPPGAQDSLLESLQDQGALEIRPLFKDESDPELAAVYVVEFKGRSSERRILKTLRSAPEIEYVERPVKRRPMA